MRLYQSILARGSSASKTTSNLTPPNTDPKIPARRKIGLLDHIGGGNLGDDATQTAVIQHITRRWPNSDIYGFTMNPSDTQARHGIPSYPIRQHTWDFHPRANDGKAALQSKLKTRAAKYQVIFSVLRAINALARRMPRALFREIRLLARSWDVLRSFDLLIVNGGGQLLDAWGGPWKFPYTIFKWVFLARLLNVRCYFINLGAGPIDHSLGKWFIRRALLLASYVSFRDEDSKTLVESIGFTGVSQVVADSVYGLEVPAPDPKQRQARNKPIVGFSPMAYCDPRIYHEKDATRYADFLQKLAVFSSWLMRNHYSVMPFSTDLCFDSDAIEDFVCAVKKNDAAVKLDLIRPESIKTTEELLAQMSVMDYIITCRFHGVIFAHLMNIPVLAVAHHPKVAKLMSDFGLSEYCVDISDFEPDMLIEKFSRMVNNRDYIKAKIAETAALQRRDLIRQFDTLFGQEGD